MNKSDFIHLLETKIKTVNPKDVETIVDAIFDQMTQTLIKGDRIEIRGFGSFEVRVREPRQGRNPKSGASVYVGNRKVPFFKVGKELKERVNQGASA